MTTIAELPAKWAEKVLSAQSTFRSVMDAMARPGTVHRIMGVDGCPAPMMRGVGAIALTLFDHDTPIWLDQPMALSGDSRKWLKFHTSAPVIDDPSVGSFALVADPKRLPPLDLFALGSDEYPDRSTTLVLQIESLDRGDLFTLQGPGIDGSAPLRATLQPDDIFARRAALEPLFPRGIDIVLVADDNIVALPRTTRLVRTGD